MGSKWVFNEQYDSFDLKATKYEARLVAKGFIEREGDSNKIFSHMVNCSLIGVLELEQLDVKMTFLHDELEKQIYMQKLEGFVSLGHEDRV